MNSSPKLIAPRLPRGFEDRGAADIAATDAMIATIRGVYERYGFDPVETPLFEYTEALGKFLPDTDRPNAGVFSLQDDDEQWLSLRYDLTAPLARHFAENHDRLPKPYRTYRAGYVFRNEKPGPGRFRQFMQFDADTVGAAGPEADAEMCMMMADTMDALGLRGKYVVKVNNRKVLDGVLETIGLSGPEQTFRRLSVLRAIDKLDRLGLSGVRELLAGGRNDESGDFTAGAGLSPKQVDGIEAYIRTGVGDGGNRTSIDALFQILQQSDVGIEGGNELQAMSALFLAGGYEGRIQASSTVVRGLEYYTGPVFEIELTFPVTNEKGQEVVFGSVGGGGRYDGLVSRFRKEPVPATGFSIGVSRLAQALKLTGNLGASEPAGPVVVLVMDREETARYQALTSRLRNAGIRAEMYLGQTRNFGKQVAYADRRNAPAVVIQGSDERARGVVQIKDMVAGREAAAAIKDNAEWKAERPGQFECPEAELEAQIGALLDRRR
jgi:histidyl-tRNA synthetase